MRRCELYAVSAIQNKYYDYFFIPTILVKFADKSSSNSADRSLNIGNDPTRHKSTITLGWGIPVPLQSNAGSSLLARSWAISSSSSSYSCGTTSPNGCKGSRMMRWADRRPPITLQYSQIIHEFMRSNKILLTHGKGAIQVSCNVFSWKFDTHPPPRNANNAEPYTFVTL